MNRRRALTLAGAAAVGSLAGCAGGGSGESGGEGGQPLREHPAAAGLDGLPRRGSLDGHAILTFEDPSCTRCRAFHEEVVPRIRSNVVDPGEGAYVLRTYPVVYPWGESATQALASTHVRSEPAFWSLLDHYFATQGQFDADNVLDRTEAFLDAQTDLDGGAVVADAANEAHDEAVRGNLDAADAAGLGRTTPVVLLFRDGEYVTSANGSVSYDLIAETLGVDG
ncbi:MULTISPECIES: DsbA family protein [Halorubrum]|uniref:DSBA-like thioredoxin domain-containing protein n=1 Tax=Halorubrum hochstenium ATCC 700873 TaxID=1227481 RepID=M0FAC1_9EURY|nr:MULTISPECIES: thioredoxin domain-containing protein [Halorubrum]ELZ56197.1 DSBA-like thioredoxin domain-containing protein [Halorubrum hochstenium ATCC 700873]